MLPVTRLIFLLVLCSASITRGEEASFKVLHRFSVDSPVSGTPQSHVVLHGDRIYGAVAPLRGSDEGYRLFSFDTKTGAVREECRLPNSPGGPLTLHGHTLFGTTVQVQPGMLFAFDTRTHAFQSFYKRGYGPLSPSGSLVVANGVLYGASLSGGDDVETGALFSVKTDGTGFRLLHDFDFDNEGEAPSGVVTDGNRLYGTTYGGGDHDAGIIYSINHGGPRSPDQLVEHAFEFDADQDGKLDKEELKRFVLEDERRGSDTGIKILHHFRNRRGRQGPLVYFKGKLFGTANSKQNRAIIFSISTDGSGFRILHEFEERVDIQYACQMLIASGRIYGTTTNGGSLLGGSVYSMRLDGGDYRTIYEFSPKREFTPSGIAIQGKRLYGTFGLTGTTNVGGIYSLAIP